METKYDKKIDAKYVQIKKGKIAHTKKEQEWLLFDCAKNGDVLGVEILNASKHLVSLSTIAGKLFGYSIVQSSLGSDDKSLRFTIESPQTAKESQFALA